MGLSREDVERIRRSLMMSRSLPYDVLLKLVDAVTALLDRPDGGCCRDDPPGK
jgi:hypothetical protein